MNRHCCVTVGEVIVYFKLAPHVFSANEISMPSPHGQNFCFIGCESLDDKESADDLLKDINKTQFKKHENYYVDI